MSNRKKMARGTFTNILVVLAFMLFTPIVLQVVYTIPLVEPRISADSVLQFWGTIAGLFIGGKVLGEAKGKLDWETRAEYFPRFEASVESATGASVLQIENKGAYPFIILSVCNVPVNWTIAPGAKESLLFPEAAQPKHIKRKDHARSVELLHGDSLEYLLTTKTGEFVDGFSLFQDGSTGKWTVSAL